MSGPQRPSLRRAAPRGSLAVAAGVWLLHLGAAAGGPTPSGRCLLMDTDMDLDDAMALAYSCVVDSEDLRAVTVSGTGWVRNVTQGAETVRRLLQLCDGGRSGSVEVAAGQARSLSNTSFHFPAAWTKEAQHFFDTALPAPSAPSNGGKAEEAAKGAAASAAADLIVRTARACQAEGRPLDIVVTAPMTNLAEALRLAPDLLKKAVADVFFIGGNLDGILGNNADCGGRSNAAECNVFMDAVAANEVLHSGLKLHVMDTQSVMSLPLPVGLPYELKSGLQKRELSPMQHFLVETLRVFLATTTHQLYFYDPSVAVWRHQHAMQARQHVADRSPWWGGYFPPHGHWPWSGGGDFCMLSRSPRLGVVLNSSDFYGTMVQDTSAGVVDLCWLPNAARFAVSFFGAFVGEKAAASIHLAAGRGRSPLLGGFAGGTGAVTALLLATLASAVVGLRLFGFSRAAPRIHAQPQDAHVLRSPLLPA